MDHRNQQPVSEGRTQGLRDRFADNLGIGQQRKANIYVDLSNAAALRDTIYWLQILFAAGIATLGLVLSSPAVIIGAMLISPLMGPILAGGLALAAGDLTLGFRAFIKLGLSCLVAVSFAVFLVALLPFKEITAEIAGRTRPNILDLVIALFSGTIGSVAICKEVKGVVTSIPGVAIAVALMPPLCVVGYGIGVALSLNGAEGMSVARGGGLLFLTNLVAIMFTAMLVFLALHLDTQGGRERVAAQRKAERADGLVHTLMLRYPASEKVRRIAALPSRIIFIALILVLILIPLSRSFVQLRDEITQKQRDNRIVKAATEVWQQKFARLPNGQARSSIGHVSHSDQNGTLAVQLRIFTSKPLSPGERAQYTRTLAERLSRSEDSLAVQLVEIPTASGDLATKREESKSPATVAELQTDLSSTVDSSLRTLHLPAPAQLVNYRTETNKDQPLAVRLIYLSDRDISAEAQDLIIDEIRRRLNYPNAVVSFERVESTFGPLTFSRNQTTLSETGTATIDRAGQILQQHPTWRIEIAPDAEANERGGTATERAKSISDYLNSKWEVTTDRITSGLPIGKERIATLTLTSEAKK